jgi:hypothetical protein
MGRRQAIRMHHFTIVISISSANGHVKSAQMQTTSSERSQIMGQAGIDGLTGDAVQGSGLTPLLPKKNA